MLFEHRSQPLLPNHKWRQRILGSLGCAVIIVAVALGVGIIGYHTIGDLPWIDSFLEAAMILGGMGAVAPMHTAAVKIFAGIYALFCGFVVLSTTGVVLAPWLHRMMHQFHVDEDNDERTPQ
jgi:hypothetical protein